MRPVHTFLELDLCPACRARYKECAEPLCLACAPPDPLAELERWRHGAEERLAAEAATGEVGSLAGLGFEPVRHPSPERVVFFSPEELAARTAARAVRPAPTEAPDRDDTLRFVLLMAVIAAAAWLLYTLTAR